MTEEVVIQAKKSLIVEVNLLLLDLSVLSSLMLEILLKMRLQNLCNRPRER